ncbi:MAG: DUF4105 domain-containing protein [Salinisphaeraceae bacterium]
MTDARRRGRLLAGPLALLLAALSGPVPAAENVATGDLAESRAWLALLHYRPTAGGEAVSAVVSDDFFLTSEGRTDPAAELAALRRALTDGGRLPDRDRPAHCLFPARTAWLVEQLDLTTPDASACVDLQRWQARLDPDGVSLVFPAAYTGSAASLFGHSLLRLDVERDGELLAHAVNFAAITGEDAGLGFAWRGLTGGYTGQFGVFAYYEKVRDYAWIENRDIWSYPLDLTADERRRLVAHLWELRGAKFEYFFLNRNCAFQLLTLLEAVRPSLDLSSDFVWYAIPADTIRAVDSVPGLLGQPSFRPALGHRLQVAARRMTPANRRLALAVSRGERAPDAAAIASLSPSARARVLELAHDHVYYRIQVGRLPPAAGDARLQAILLARSRVKADSKRVEPATPAVAPHAGHASRRAGVSVVNEDGDWSLGLHGRVAYHDLLDPPGGYSEGTQLAFLSLDLRLDTRRDRIEIDRLGLLDIVSLRPRDALFDPWSWQLAAGLRQRPVSAPADPDGHLGAFVEGGPGLAWSLADRITSYVFGLGSMDGNHGYAADYALGVGASAGVLATLRNGWRLRAEIGALDHVAGNSGHRHWASLTQQWSLADGLGLRARLTAEDTVRHDLVRARLTLLAYF